MVSFEKFVKSMPPSLSELKVIHSFCFAFKIPDDVTATNIHIIIYFRHENNFELTIIFLHKIDRHSKKHIDCKP